MSKPESATGAEKIDIPIKVDLLTLSPTGSFLVVSTKEMVVSVLPDANQLQLLVLVIDSAYPNPCHQQ